LSVLAAGICALILVPRARAALVAVPVVKTAFGATRGADRVVFGSESRLSTLVRRVMGRRWPC
jgi:hypothetical protein